ncbi:MAG: ABC transporter substrate-binding protein [Spirochaetaceae bacterium]|nr:MAG: ABC transporter substrate-binding protein [Spirochaetaceae bacterium]
MCFACSSLPRAGCPRVRRLALSVLHGAILLLIATPGLSSRPMAEDLPTMVITDALGREVVMPRPAERIAMGGRAVLMLADALYLFPGASKRLVGVGHITQGKGNFLEAIDPHYHDDRTIFASAVGPEQIAATRPDVVILKSIMRNELGDAISQLGIPVVYVDLETPEQYKRDLRIFGRILEQEARAEELVAYFGEIRRRVQQRTASLLAEQKPRVLLLSYSESAGEPVFSIPPSRWIQSDLVRAAGGDPVWVDEHPGGGWAPVGFEQIAAWDPDKIMLVAYRHGIDQVTERVRRRPQWRELRAVRDGHLYGFAADFYSWDQPDVRWLLGLQWLATRIQPEVFSDLDINAAMRDFFSTLYAMTDAEIDSVIVPRLEGDLH